MSNATTEKPGTAPILGTPASRRLPVLVGAVVVVLIVTVVAVRLVGSSNAKVPYVDARSAGPLTLCGADGQPVTSGSTTQKPFVSRAVGATAVPGPAAGSGRTATLYAFQPRNGAESEEWSGQLLTAASSYTNTRHPMAQATAADIALKEFLIAFPPRWNHLIQLRLYVASPASGIAATYDTTTIRIDGDSWKVVGKAGTASCTDGSATSNETSAHVQ
ncbi:MAG: hypothetical protein JWQ32_965 [Marmoricola sp.]|nr:hypothetical protein [Marmoricola sp.]